MGAWLCGLAAFERRRRLRLRAGSASSSAAGRPASPGSPDRLAIADDEPDGLRRLRFPLPPRGTSLCASPRPAADAPDSDGFAPCSGSFTCLNHRAARSLPAAQGALSILRWRDCTSAALFRQTFFKARIRPALHGLRGQKIGAPHPPWRNTSHRHHSPAAFFCQRVFASAVLLFISPPHRRGRPHRRRALGNRLTVDQRTLTPLVLVRIQVPQPMSSFGNSTSSNCPSRVRRDLMPPRHAADTACYINACIS